MTIYDIAKEAGVSASTVSRVMNNKPGIREETREKVMSVVNKYNFAPDETARGLVKQSTKTIGLLIADVRIAFYMYGIHVIISEMAKRGYCCILLSTGVSNEERAEYIKILSQRRVEGAILIGAGYQCDEVREAIGLYMKDVPVVMINGRLEMPNVYSVLTDERRNTELCFDYIFGKGYKHPAYVGCGSIVSNQKRLAGLSDSVEKHDPALGVPVYIGDEAIGFGYDITRRVMEEHPETDAVYYSADCFAVAGMRMLEEMGMDVPERMGVITGEDSIYSTIAHPYITALDGRINDICVIACQNMIKILSGADVPKIVTLMPEVIERETMREVK